MTQLAAARTAPAGAAVDAAYRPAPSLAHRLVRNRRVIFGATVVLGATALALVAPVVATDPTAQVLIDRLQAPSTAHPMGTDDIGRDILARSVWGARVTMTVSLAATVITIVIGLMVGLVSGFMGGWVDNLMMRFTDVFIAFPIFILLLTVGAIFGHSLLLMIFFLGISAWPQTARLVRAETLSLRSRDFVLAALSIGGTSRRIMFVHILPHLVPVIAVAAALRAGVVILIESGLSYFGVGVPPPNPTWGGLAAAGRGYLDSAWWMTTLPGLLIILMVISYNILGDGLRAEMDPRRRPESLQRSGV